MTTKEEYMDTQIQNAKKGYITPTSAYSNMMLFCGDGTIDRDEALSKLKDAGYEVSVNEYGIPILMN